MYTAGGYHHLQSPGRDVGQQSFSVSDLLIDGTARKQLPRKFSRSEGATAVYRSNNTDIMAEEGGNSHQLIKCLKKFDGQASAYPEWKYNTRRVIGLYKPTISKILAGYEKPEPICEEVESGDDAEEHGEEEDGQHQESQDGTPDPESNEILNAAKLEMEASQQEYQAALKRAQDAEAAIAEAEDEGNSVTRAMTKELEDSTTAASFNKKIATLATQVYAEKVSTPKPKRVPARRKTTGGYIITNKHDIDEYEEADKQLFNILFLVLTGAASYILRRLAPADESSGSGIAVWTAIEEKYQPVDQNRRRDLERQLDNCTMESGTDPDIFITKVWHLAEQIQFIGGSISEEKVGDIILQGLPREYGLIIYHADADDSYDMNKITNTARKLYYSRNRKQPPASERRHKDSARDSGMTATYEHRQQRPQVRSGPVRCHECNEMGHIRPNCPKRVGGQRTGGLSRAYPRQRPGRTSSRPITGQRTNKWCSLHNTHLHSDAECKAQAAGRTAAATTERQIQLRPTQDARNLRREGPRINGRPQQGAHMARDTARAGPTEETTVEGYSGNLGFPFVADNINYEDQDAGTTVDGRLTFLVDSGASHHYLDSEKLHNIDDILDQYRMLDNPTTIVGAGGHEFRGRGTGILHAQARDGHGVLRKVQFKCITVPGLGRHLFSTGTAQKKGAHTIISDDPRIDLPGGAGGERGFTIKLRTDRTLIYLDLKIDFTKGRTSEGAEIYDIIDDGHVYTAVRPESINLWHRRLAHCHEGILRAAAKIAETGIALKDELTPCRTCRMQKSKQKNHPKTAHHTAEHPCQRVYTDLLGPIEPTAKGGYKYVSKFTCEYSRMNAVYLIKSKDEAVDTLDRYHHDIVIPHVFRMHFLRTDCGGEYIANYYKEYCQSIGIVQEFTAPATPQQNGISERAGQTLMNMTRCLLNGAGLPLSLWGEVCCTAVHITNRLRHAHLGHATPYFRMFGKQASLKHLRVIGCRAFVDVEVHTSKLQPKAWEGQLIGYSPNSRVYRIYNQKTGRIVSSRNVTFIEPMDVAMPPADPTSEDIVVRSSDIPASTSEIEGAYQENDHLHQESDNVSRSSSDASEGAKDDESDNDSDHVYEDNNYSGRRTGLRSDPTAVQEGQRPTHQASRQRAQLRRLAP